MLLGGSCRTSLGVQQVLDLGDGCSSENRVCQPGRTCRLYCLLSKLQPYKSGEEAAKGPKTGKVDVLTIANKRPRRRRGRWKLLGHGRTGEERECFHETHLQYRLQPRDDLRPVHIAMPSSGPTSSCS